MRLLLVLLFFPLFSFSQTDLQLLDGLWVKVKAEMKDGSRIVDRKGCGMEFLKYNIAQDGFMYRSGEVLFNGYRQSYKKNGNTLMIGGETFNVMKLTDDTLKLSALGGKGGDDQTPVYYFKKVQHHSGAAAATYSPALKDSVYVVNHDLFPQCNYDFGNFMNVMSGRFEVGVLKASFIVDKKGVVSNFTVLQADSISNNFTKAIGKALVHLDWQPARRNDAPVNSIVTITFTSKRRSVYGEVLNTLSIEYPFMSKFPYSRLDRDEAESEQQYFGDATDAFNKQNYGKAVELLGKCVDMDNIDLNAYYLRADAYTKLGKNKEACKDWATLAGLGQVIAAKKLAELCKN